MKTNTLIAFFVQILLIQNCYSQKPLNAEITYIGTEGFMIKNNDNKIFTDALYNHYEPGTAVVSMDEEIEKMIMEGSDPFSNSQLFMVTHNHPDHYNADKVKQFLTNNPTTKLVAPSGAINGIKDAALQEQLVSLNAAKNESIDRTVNGIQISVYNLMHDKLYGTEYNSGYFVNLDGLKILHCGDNVLDDSTEIKNYKLNEKNIDIAFFAKNSFKTEQRKELMRKYINPKYIILMHINPDSVNAIKERFKNFIPPVFVFSASMEKLILTDSIRFENRRPEKVSAISDTTLKINTFFEYKLPVVFDDPDINDSLSYSMSGLPTGLNFDSEKMIISGAPSEAGIYVAKITAKDKSLCSNSISFEITVGDETGIVNTKQEVIIVYPTIFSDKIYVTNLNSKSTISVFTIEGILITKIQTRESSLQIDLSNLNFGFYLVRVENKTGAYSKRILKCYK
jgi:L-ascorbate metabolism protein UlaG (beta-lactamase superfamily)